MSRKWYISTFIIILTLIGAVCEQQISVPNQEIVLQFTNVEVTSEDAQNTLAIVKKQLQSLGVENIQVNEEVKGSLRITYYSDTDIALIKKTLSKEKNLELDYKCHTQNKKDNQLPDDEDTIIGYNLDIHEIQDGNDADWSFEGNYVLESNLKTDRFFNPNLYLSIQFVDVRNKEVITEVAYKVNRNIAIAIDNTSHNIPEVRAGPVS